MAAPRRGVLLAMPLSAVGPRLIGATDEQVVNAILPDVAKPFPHLEGMVRAVRVYRWEHGWTVFRTGSLAHLARVPALRGEHPRLALAGEHLSAPNVEGAVTSGLRAAEQLLALAR